ncbi:hypothetical protein ICE94_01075 [Polynucleobacter sp. MWH-Loch1C5]|uniref:hypothetical protein n=1 Tax=Polynucleobacter sp. MWH-Loch1C5 TaxID=2689108 RepID=UPI001C0D0BBF|nr:hypothetical protein [Polynucleobacter sp. MWH-Loch1C5]MBU3541863.1 hypothetical protein [Polynucleobacter sp. MWH-Loch1C5]
MKARIWIWILWPSFMIAGLAEGLLFTLVHPEDLVFFGEPVTASVEAVYTLGFFVLWLLCALSSALTIYILPGSLSDLEERADGGLL